MTIHDKRRKVAHSGRSRSDEDLEEVRTQNEQKLQNRFSAIYAKYSRDFTGISDEIDHVSGEVVVDNGHLKKMRHERDLGTDQPRAQRDRELGSCNMEDELACDDEDEEEEGFDSIWADPDVLDKPQVSVTQALASDVVSAALPQVQQWDSSDPSTFNDFSMTVMRQVSHLLRTFQAQQSRAITAIPHSDSRAPSNARNTSEDTGAPGRLTSSGSFEAPAFERDFISTPRGVPVPSVKEADDDESKEVHDFAPRLEDASTMSHTDIWPWSQYEDRTLLALFNQPSRDWYDIQRRIPFRSRHAIECRWATLSDRVRVPGPSRKRKRRSSNTVTQRQTLRPHIEKGAADYENAMGPVTSSGKASSYTYKRHPLRPVDTNINAPRVRATTTRARKPTVRYGFENPVDWDMIEDDGNAFSSPETALLQPENDKELEGPLSCHSTRPVTLDEEPQHDVSERCKRRIAWTDEQDFLLMNLRDNEGRSFGEIAKAMPGRTVSAVTMHYSILARRRQGPLDQPGHEEEPFEPGSTSPRLSAATQSLPAMTPPLPNVSEQLGNTPDLDDSSPTLIPRDDHLQHAHQHDHAATKASSNDASALETSLKGIEEDPARFQKHSTCATDDCQISTSAEKQAAPNKPRKRGRHGTDAWTDAEDNQLVRLKDVKKMSWLDILSYLPGRSEGALVARHWRLKKKRQSGHSYMEEAIIDLTDDRYVDVVPPGFVREIIDSEVEGCCVTGTGSSAEVTADSDTSQSDAQPDSDDQSPPSDPERRNTIAQNGSTLSRESVKHIDQSSPHDPIPEDQDELGMEIEDLTDTVRPYARSSGQRTITSTEGLRNSSPDAAVPNLKRKQTSLHRSRYNQLEGRLTPVSSSPASRSPVSLRHLKITARPAPRLLMDSRLDADAEDELA